MQNTRIASLDIFRALTMLMMLWVNDFAGVSGIPHWMKHAAMDEDMLGFSDLVFPAFLFCVGLSLPIAIGSRYKKGSSTWEVIGHILLRSLALIVMGLFSMNGRAIEGGIPRQWWSLILVTAYFMVWNVKVCSKWVRIAGVAVLAGLVAYRLAFGESIRIGWWGILGLIGWAYLACSLVYLLVRKSFKLNLVALVLLFGLMFLVFCGAKFMDFYPGGWTHVCIVFCGVVASQLMRRKNFIPTALVCGVVSLGLAFLCHQFWIISKIQATPTWVFYCVALYFPVLALLYWVADVRKSTKWSRPIQAAGTATLTCYTLPTVWYAVQGLLGLYYPAMFCTGGFGLLRSFVFALAIILIAELLGKINIRLKL